MKTVWAIAVVAFGSACTSAEAPPPPQDAPEATAPEPVVERDPEPAYVSALTSVRRTPTTAKKIEAVDHSSPHTSSSEIYHGVLNGHARGVFNGKIIVHKDAQKTDAHLSNKNLLLSNNAEVDTKPELEIYADDVKCSHGATVGRLDKDMLYYLRTRAIREDIAKSLLTFAFAEDVISQVRIPEIRKRLEQTIIGKLPDTELIKEFLQ